MIKNFCLMALLWMAAVQAFADNKVQSETYAKKYGLIKRPWEIRYVLRGEELTMMQIKAEQARVNNEEIVQNHMDLDALEYDGLFDPTHTFAYSKPDTLAVELILFDRNGRVMTPNHSTFPLMGRHRFFRSTGDLHDDLSPADASSRKVKPASFQLDYIELIELGNWSSPPYHLAYWLTDPSGTHASFVPAVCNDDDFDRYRQGWEVKGFLFRGNFGCREWTYQLFDKTRPYIDVTSYEKEGTFIKEFTGWSRFTDPPKPVIGRNDKTWLCLFDCPGGEAPGAIADIAAWAKKHGYPVPRPPEKQPTFPDADFDNSAEE
jgi:hypothetical protein